MSPDVPPPLPNAAVAWKTYLAATVFLLPVFAVWSFSTIFLSPRLEFIWQQAGLAHSRANWLLDTSHALKDNFRWVVAALVVLFVVLEYRVRAWPRYRRAVVASMVFVLNTLVLVGLTLLCISALLAAPLLAKTH